MSSKPSPAPAASTSAWKTFWPMLLCLLLILSALFYRCFQTDVVLFSNDGPLGVQHSDSTQLPGAFHGVWYLGWIGASGGYVYRSVTEIFRWLVGPEGFAKFYEPFSVLVLGVCAWTFFRSLGLRAALCVVGAIAAMLNSNFFSNACWGLGSRAISLSMVFLALALLNARRLGKQWLNAALAGFAVGMAVVEGADNGVIFSLCVAAFVVFQSIVQGRSLGCRTVRSTRLILVAGFALFMAMQALIGLFGLAQKGAVGAEDPEDARAAKWAFATQWSMPPAETLRVLIPGLYGYRMDAPDGDSGKAYWGRVGEDPIIPERTRRFNGSGEYAGLLVVLLAGWAIAASFSRKLGVYSKEESKMIWFWTGVAGLSILFAWGRFAPFYQLIYALPYFSSIRNPMKFMHVTHMALMILFGYGLLGLSRRYLGTAESSEAWGQQWKSWWAKALPFERRWVWTGVGLVVLSALGYLFYGGSREDLVQHLLAVGYPDPDLAAHIARNSIAEVGLFVLFLALSLGALALVMGGVFTGRRATWAAVLLGLLLTVDLARADRPWIVFWNVKQKYASNPVLDILKEKPFESRVAFPENLINGQALSAAGGYTRLFPSVYSIEWVQHHFLYYDIQALDVGQDPRPPADKLAYMRALTNPYRYWQLTSARYLLGMSGFLDALNTQLSPGKNEFKIHTAFNIVGKPGVRLHDLQDLTAVATPNGPLALFEFTGALPRASLYTHWQVVTNDEQTLITLVNPAFNPSATVLISDEIPAAADTANSNGGTVEFISYHSRRVELHAHVTAPAVLLLNDRYDQNWHVTVDGKPAPLLRANYIMRGVQLSPGDHTVAFDFSMKLTGVTISLVAMAIAAVLCLLLFVVRQAPETE